MTCAGLTTGNFDRPEVEIGERTISPTVMRLWWIQARCSQESEARLLMSLVIDAHEMALPPPEW